MVLTNERLVIKMKTHAIIFIMNDGTLKTVYCNFDEVAGIMWRMSGKYKKSTLKENK